MKLLYKYYSNESKYSLENFENANISFSPLESLNDPFEGVGAYIYPISHNEKLYWDSIGSNLPKMFSKRYSEDVWDMLNFKYRVFCSSKDYNNFLLWSYYANAHRGFCVGYKEEDIKETSDELLDVKYRNGMCVINELDNDIIKDLLTTKSCDWHIEDECRALYVLKESDVSHLSPEVYFNKENGADGKIYKLHGHVQTNNLETLCSDKFIIKKCEPFVVYLGIRMNWNDKKRIIESAKKFNIKVYQMCQEDNSFDLVPKEV